MNRISLGIAFLFALFSCSKPTSENQVSDTSAVSMDTTLVDEMEAANDEPPPPITIDYNHYNSIDSDIEIRLATFPPLQEVLNAAARAIRFKDSLEYERQTTDLKDPADSALFMPRMNDAYEKIIAYQQAMRTGIKLNAPLTRLTDLVRMPGPEDKTSEMLPEAKNSSALSHGNFLFLGGAPFVYQVEGVFESPTGSAEWHYEINTPENTNYLFNAFCRREPGGAEVTFGPELLSYDSGPQEVKGIGSLIHTFNKRITVWLLTRDGVESAVVISTRIKLMPEQMGCIVDTPLYTIAAFSNLDPHDILGIYIPYFNGPHGPMDVQVLNDHVWTADVTGDGIADFAGVVGGRLGEASGSMLGEALWFVNINGEWRIIDAGFDPDCT